MMNWPIARFLSASAILAGQPAESRAVEVARSIEIKASPAAVWAIVSDFCAIARWHPRVERCTLSDSGEADGETAAMRSLIVAGGLGTIVEVETDRDETTMSYSYAFVSGPLPVKAYNATLAVRPIGANSTVVWTATFDAAGMSDADAKADIEGVYEQGLAAIAREATK